MKKFKAVLYAVLYFALYFAVHIFIETVISVVYLIRNSAEFYVSGKGFDLKAATLDLGNFLNSNIYLLTIIADVIFVAVVFFIFKAQNKKFSFEIELKKTNPLNLLPVIAIGFSLNILTSLLFLIVPEKWLESYTQSSESIASATGVVAFLSITLVGPIAEEMLFRGLIFTRLSRGLGITASVIASAVIFGIAHGNIVWTIYTAVLGVILAVIYIYTRSIICPILVHSSFNLANYVVEDIDLFVLISAFAVCAASAAALIAIGKYDRRNVGSDA